MSARATEAEGLGVAGRCRSRWPVFFGALALLWCAYWYCRGEGQGLLLVTAGFAAAALALPRSLPGNTRWVVWTGLLVLVVCLAANVARLVSPEGASGESRLWDRVVTVLYGFGVTALLFRPCAAGVTAVVTGGLPMVMLALSRGPYEAGNATGFEMAVAWGFLALAVTLEQVQRLTQPPQGERAPPGLLAAGWRLAAAAAVLALAFAVRVPVERAAVLLQQKLLGLMISGPADRARRKGEMSLLQAPSKNFGERMRVVVLLQAAELPGYLRERAFSDYADGRWAAAAPGAVLEAAGTEAEGRGQVYPLRAASAAAAVSVWRVEVLCPALLDGLCLPGTAVQLTCEGAPPLANADGVVTVSEALPERYGLTATRSRLTESAYPLPDGAAAPAYRAVPQKLAGPVSNWVAACEGLARAPTAREAVVLTERYFHTNFAYRLGVRLKAKPDPLVDFMARREGSCTLFASAAALMLRSSGVPARVVGGYVCCAWNPLLERWVVRERDAHAWVEAWDAAEGRWLLADPTPPGGQPHALEPAGRLRETFDLLVAAWHRFLAGLRGADLLTALADAGETLFRFLWHVVSSVAGLAVMAGFALVAWLRRRTRAAPLSKAERARAELAAVMRGVERRMVESRLRRRAAESWDEWVGRVASELPAERAEALRAWVESYQALRYAAELDESEARGWIAGARRAFRWAPGRERGRREDGRGGSR